MTPTELIIPPQARASLREAIRRAGGNEVLFFGRVEWDEEKPEAVLVEVEVFARGHRSAVPAIVASADEWDLAIHNHPTGRLEPSEADLAVAYELGNRSVGFAIIDNVAERHYLVVPPFRRTRRRFIDPAEVEWVFGERGPIARELEGYRVRPGQIAMALEVTRALNENSVVACEAGTGVGKSFAYLVPAILWAEANRERVIVSTGTIHLQEQLVGKDLPFLEKVLDVNFRYALAKGRGNYACRRKLAELPVELRLSPPEGREALALEELLAWGEATRDGSRADLPAVPRAETWERVMSETDKSLKTRCEFYETCFFYEAKRRASRSHILVVNHHLFFSDLGARRESRDFDQDLILPRYRRVIFDEAHHLEDVAGEHLSVRFSRRSIALRLGRMASRERQRGRLPVLVEKLIAAGDDRTARALARELGDTIHQSAAQIGAHFDRLEDALSVALGPADFGILSEPGTAAAPRSKIRYVPDSPREELWAGVRELVFAVRAELARIANASHVVLEDLAEAAIDVDTRASVSIEIESFANRLERLVEEIAQFADFADGTRVRWIDPLEGASRRDGGTLAFAAAPIRVAGTLAEHLYGNLETAILTSATLAVGGKPTFLAERLGLDRLSRERFRFSTYESPYDYERNVLTLVPDDAAEPGTPRYERELIESVFRIVEASRGRAFVLFTSHSLLERTYNALESRLRAIGIRSLAHGQAQRSELLRRFREGANNVLFGTDSFWEGVDVRGRALECVIITRLPFRVPTDPLTEARVEEIQAAGRDPFRSLSIPQAVLRFKQGFGRLIRSETDRGVVVVLDSRIVGRSYGRLFLASVPRTARVIAPVDQVIASVGDFFAGEASVADRPELEKLAADRKPNLSEGEVGRRPPNE